MGITSLNYHLLGYSLTASELCLCAATCLTAIPYALRHFEQSNRPDEVKWAHRLIGVIECIPILGCIVALIESYIHCIDVFPQLNEEPPETAQRLTEFQQLPQAERHHLKSSAFKMLKTTASSVRSPKIHSTRYDSLYRWNYLGNTTKTTPEAFIRSLQTLAPTNAAWHTASYDGDTALHWAVRSGQSEFIRYVLNIHEGRGLLDRASNTICTTPLMTAIITQFVSEEANREEIVELLLAANANANLHDDVQATPLHAAIEKGHLPLIRHFLQHPEATLRFVDNEPNPPLSENGLAALLLVYRQIETALQDGIESLIGHKDVHSIIYSYYWRV